MSQHTMNQAQPQLAQRLHHDQADGMRRAQQQWAQQAAQQMAPRSNAGMAPQQMLPQSSAGMAPQQMLPQSIAGMAPQQMTPQSRGGVAPQQMIPQSHGGMVPQHLYGTMAPSAKYSDIPVIEDDDFYFLGHMDNKPPFTVTAKPAYFDDFEAACWGDQVAALQRITSENALSPAVLHHGLILALAAGSVDSARELLVSGAPIARRAPEEILLAPQDKQVPLFDVLATQRWKPSHDLFMRVITNTDLLRWFLSHDINPNYGIKRDTPTKAGGPSDECADALEIAASTGDVEAIEILIAAGAKVAYGTPLHCAAGAASGVDTIPAMAALVEHGADVNQKEDTPHLTVRYPLLYAVQAGAVQRARWLLEHGADPELKGPTGNALELATRIGNKTMKELFQTGARAL